LASDALNPPDRINSQSTTNISSIANTAVCARMTGYGDLLENLLSRTSFVKRSKLIPDHTDKVSTATLFVSLHIFQIATLERFKAGLKIAIRPTVKNKKRSWFTSAPSRS